MSVNQPACNEIQSHTQRIKATTVTIVMTDTSTLSLWFKA